jgi:hypothetical protein
MNKITKIVFIIESPFNQRDYERFGLETFIQDGFEVYVWDFTPFLHPEVHRKVKVSDPISYEKYCLFLTKMEAISAILKESHGLFVVSLIGYCYDSFPVFRALSKNKIPYSVSMANALPSGTQKLQPIDYLKKILRATPSKFINSVFNRIQSKYLGIKSARFILAGGEQSCHYRYPVGQKTETLWIHTLDYDIYLQESNNSVLEPNQNTGVFMDEYIPFHPDYIHLQKSPPTTPEEYYPILCRFFDCLEENYGVHINIAAHPRSKYEELPDYFGGRSVIRGETVRMIKESGFVVAHSSTALNFAVLFSKPVVFITTKKLQQSSQGEFIKLIASWFGKLPINIDNPIAIDWDKELTVDEKAYSKYKNCYIKKNGSEDIPFWQAVSKRIKSFDV